MGNVTHVRNMRCPECGSDDIYLWNSLKQTLHCHSCDCYFRNYGPRVGDTYEPPRRRTHRGGWNGFTDPDDFPTDGFDGGGW